jgi:sugar phosphate permease
MSQEHVSTQAVKTTAATHVRYLVLAAACTLALLTYVHRLGFVVANRQIKESLALSTEEMGYLASAFLLAYGLFQIPGGWLADRFGSRHVLTLLVLAWSLLTGALAGAVLLPAGTLLCFGYVYVLRFLFGMTQAGGFPTLSRVIADWMPAPSRATALGTVWMFSRIGGAVIPLGFLWLFKKFEGWTIPFEIIGGLGVLWCLVFWPWFRNRPEEMPQVNDAECALIAGGRSPKRERGGASSPGPRPRLPLGRALTSRSVWGLCLLYGSVGFAGNFITNLLPLYLTEHRHLSDEDAMIVSTLPLAFGIVSCVLGGAVSDWSIRIWGSRKWGRRLTGAIGLAAAGVAFRSTIWVENMWLLAALVSLTFFFNDLNMGPAWAACADIGGPYTGTLSGAMNMMGSVFGAAGAVLTGYMLASHQDDLLFIIYGCCYGLAAACWFLVDVTKPL